jgi:phage recombination protein Bet
MTSTDLATTSTGGTGLVLDADQERWNDRQLAALRQLGVTGAGPGDLAVFLHVSQRTGLDPFARQIYMIERQGKQTIQTGIDGFRLVARRAVDRAGETLSIEAAEWRDQQIGWTDAWLEDRPPAAARVTVVRAAQRFTAVALMGEYMQTKRDGNPMAMWATRPAGMLAKCAEALALRKAFPMDLSGVYTEDEFAREDSHQSAERRGGLSDALAARRAKDGPGSPYLDINSDLAKRMFATFGDLGITDRDARLTFVSDTLGRPFDSSTQMTEADASTVIAALQERLEQPFAEAQPPAEPDGDVHDAVVVEDLPAGGES